VAGGCLDEAQLAQYVAGVLPVARSVEAVDHIEHCGECKARALQVLELGAVDTQVCPPGVVPRTGGVGAALPEGSRLGRYIILEQIGKGGMGLVYAAYDPQLNRKIAVKLLRADVLGTAIGVARARLLQEAQALAQVSHPNVVAVHDVGTTGLEVFIAMDFIEGVTLADWLRERHAWREVLRIFLEAGEGLAAAHAKGIVHRDFKPQNVLITEAGRAYVVDFGLARGIGAGLDTPRMKTPVPAPVPSESRPDLTLAGSLVGTPMYMSPELFHAHPADARSDQFSFCVACYEGLFGQHPFSLKGENPTERVLTGGAVLEPPKQTLVPGRLRRVLLKGLSVDPSGRFPSMRSLLHALRDDPWAARKRWAMRAGAAAAALGVIGTAYALNLRQSRLCTGAERKLAGAWDPARRQAIEATFTASHLPYATDAWRGVESALDRYATDWVAMRTESCEATRIRGEQSEPDHALRMGCLDRRLNELQSLGDVLVAADPKVIEKSVAAAQALTSLRGCADLPQLRAGIQSPKDEATRTRVAALRERLARAKALDDAGKYRDGLQVLETALEDARRTEYRPLVAETLYRLGSLQSHNDAFKAAEESATDAEYEAESVRDDELAVRASTLIADLAVRAQIFETAHGWLRHASAALDRLGGDDSLAAAVEDVSSAMLVLEGKYAEALAAAQRALSFSEHAAGRAPYPAAMALLNMGRAYDRMGDYSQALHYVERGAAALEQVLGPRHPGVAVAHQIMVSPLRGLGRPEEAIQHAQRALAITEQTVGTEHPRAAALMLEEAAALTDVGRCDEAVGLSRRALAVAEKAFGPTHLLVENAHRYIAIALARSGHYAESMEEFDRAIAIDRKIRPPDHPFWAYVWTEQSEALIGLHRYADAAALLEKALESRSRHPSGPDDLAETEFLLARALVGLHQETERAAVLAGRAQAAYDKLGNARERDRVGHWLAELSR
jgi:tetratricopeptide (TPR) repeat protein/predicted Ser/Thr protein kinase